MPDLKPPPSDINAEKALLGAMMRDNSCIADVLAIVQEPAFYAYAHQKVFAALAELSNEGSAADPVTLANRIKEHGHLNDVKTEYLVELWYAAPTAAHAEDYARIIRGQAKKRNFQHFLGEAQRDVDDGKMPADELLAKYEQKILGLAEMGVEGQSRTLKQVLIDVYSRIDERAKPGANVGVPTGYVDLDRILGGLQDGEVTVVAARTSVGKTSLALGFARHSAVVLRLPTLFVSLEQSDLEVGERLLCMQSSVDSSRLKTSTLSEEDLAALLRAGDEIRAAPLHIDQTPGQGMLQIAANARRLKAKKQGLRLIVLDYIQLVEPDSRRDNRQEQVAGISRRLKGLARELSVPVVALAQLNRGPEEGKGRRPRLSDLRESDAVAHDADVVLLLWMEADRQDKAVQALPLWQIEVEVAKHRNGPTGIATLILQRCCMRFENLAVDSPSDPFVERARQSSQHDWRDGRHMTIDASIDGGPWSGWYKPRGRTTWLKRAEAESYDEAMGLLLDSVEGGGDLMVLPSNQHPDQRPTFHLTMEALPDDVPAILRLRRFLKVAKRAFGLICTSAVQDNGDGQPAPGNRPAEAAEQGRAVDPGTAGANDR